jgi:GNAT superfamily N-acetyltransferase
MMRLEALSPYLLDPALLAPGDVKARSLDWSGLRLHRIGSVDHPRFDECYQHLWREFSPAGEMERQEVIHARFRWQGPMRYEMVLVEAADSSFAAARDHTAIVLPDAGGAIVHLSHLLIAPAWRRTGLAGWMRAIPILAARQSLQRWGRDASGPVTLVGEMEPPDGRDDARILRLRAYEKAGYLKVDPGAVRYHQPDFRSAAEIDAAGGARPLAMLLILRRVGRETERSISGRELREIVACLYQMYAATFRTQDMAGLFQQLERYPPDELEIALLPPTA